MPKIAGPLTMSMFLGSFAWSFAFISLPFYIQSITNYDSAATLRWSGWILGISSLVTVVTSPAWGRVGERGDPRKQYILVQVFQGLAFMGMAIAHTLPQLFVARLILGAMGAASTLAFIIAGRRTDPVEVRREVSAVQLAMTMGQVLGPLGGATAAARFGFRPSFVLGGFILLGSAAFVHWGVRLPAHLERTRRELPRVRAGDLVVPVLLV
ncbi:MAG TPA: MFS transporter, partial [Gemmatimonadales bacterium]|nr:MFS transporter [Gemmatimonadales bacterium]